MTSPKKTIIERKGQTVIVGLTKYQALRGAWVGVTRQIQNLFGLDDGTVSNRYNCPEDKGWAAHIIGAIGEMALAIVTGCYWDGALGDYKADDVGGVYQVRSTDNPWKQSLILHKSDADDKPFVLGTVHRLTVTLEGWMYAREGKKKDWWKDPTGTQRWAYFVEKQHLHPMSTLPSAEELRNLDGATG